MWIAVLNQFNEFFDEGTKKDDYHANVREKQFAIADSSLPIVPFPTRESRLDKIKRIQLSPDNYH